MLIERRIRRNTRINKLFSKGDRLLVLGEINKYFVKSILKELPVKLFFSKKEDNAFVKKNKINKIVIQWTLDDDINAFVKALFEGGKVKKMPKNYVKLLVSATDKEIALFARIRKISFKPRGKDILVQKFLDNIEKKHHNIKYNLMKNIIVLNRLT